MSSESFWIDDHAVQSACTESVMRRCGKTATPRPADCGQVMLRPKFLVVGMPLPTVSGPEPLIDADSGVR